MIEMRNDQTIILLAFIALTALILAAAAYAEDNATLDMNSSNISNATNFTEITATVAVNQTNITNSTITENQTNSTENLTNNATISNETASQSPATNFIMSNFLPKEFMLGDVQLNIMVQNTGTDNLSNLMAVVTGKGFASYDVTPIDTLGPGEKSYILVMGTFRQAGNITLTPALSPQLVFRLPGKGFLEVLANQAVLLVRSLQKVS